MRLPAHIFTHPDGLAHIQQSKGIQVGWGGAGGVPGLYGFPAQMESVLDSSACWR